MYKCHENSNDKKDLTLLRQVRIYFKFTNILMTKLNQDDAVRNTRSRWVVQFGVFKKL